MLTTIQPPAGRGCGDRTEGSPYACCPLVADGMPIEHFVIDPALSWPGKFQRGVKILPRNPKDPDGLQDVVVFVGRKFYPSAWDYVEETKLFGASRKVSPTLPFEKLTPSESRMIFVHSRAIPAFDYELNGNLEPLYGCKYFQDWVDNKELWQDIPLGWHRDRNNNSLQRASLATNPDLKCTFALKDLSFLVHGDIIPDEYYSEYYHVIMPSFSYRAKYPTIPAAYMSTKRKWGVGIFLALPLTHIEFCRKADPEIKQKIEQAGFETATLEW